MRSMKSAESIAATCDANVDHGDALASAGGGVSKEILVAVVSGLIAVVSSAIAVWGQFRVSRLNHDIEKFRLAAEEDRNSARYREPLARSAADLQSRLYNILSQDFVGKFMVRGTPREQGYALTNTVFVFAQFFAWTEAARLEIQFISLDADEKTKALAALQSRIYSLLQSDSGSDAFRLFAGEQRAIGERMLVQHRDGLRCVGYGEFLDNPRYSSDPLLAELSRNVDALKDNLELAKPRLIALQHMLVELLDHLDPDCVRFPKGERSKWRT